MAAPLARALPSRIFTPLPTGRVDRLLREDLVLGLSYFLAVFVVHVHPVVTDGTPDGVLQVNIDLKAYPFHPYTFLSCQ